MPSRQTGGWFAAPAARVLLVGVLICSFFHASHSSAGGSQVCQVSFPEALNTLNGGQPPLPDKSGVKLLLMFVHVARGHTARHAHRQSWLSEPGMCAVDGRNSSSNSSSGSPVWSGNSSSNNRNNPAGCKVYYTFMVGVDGTERTAAAVASEMNRHGDVVVLKGSKDPAPGEEGSNSLLMPKVVEVFKYATKHFRWATHFGKVDIDSFPLVSIALNELGNPTGEARRQIEAKEVLSNWSEQNGGIYYGLLSGNRSKREESFQQGQFYVLSASLADCILDWSDHYPASFHTCKTHPASGKIGEDQMIGCMVSASGSLVDAQPRKLHLCPPAVYYNMRENPHVSAVEYRINPFGKKASDDNRVKEKVAKIKDDQGVTFGDWTHFSAQLSVIASDGIKFTPGFDEKYVCLYPASLAEDLWAAGSTAKDLIELKAEIDATSNAMADAAYTFNPDLKGDGADCNGDIYALLKGNWCTCRPGTVPITSTAAAAPVSSWDRPSKKRMPPSPNSPAWWQYSYNRAKNQFKCTHIVPRRGVAFPRSVQQHQSPRESIFSLPPPLKPPPQLTLQPGAAGTQCAELAAKQVGAEEAEAKVAKLEGQLAAFNRIV
jgi:hypothetical protein